MLLTSLRSLLNWVKILILIILRANDKWLPLIRYHEFWVFNRFLFLLVYDLEVASWVLLYLMNFGQVEGHLNTTIFFFVVSFWRFVLSLCQRRLEILVEVHEGWILLILWWQDRSWMEREWFIRLRLFARWRLDALVPFGTQGPLSWRLKSRELIKYRSVVGDGVFGGEFQDGVFNFSVNVCWNSEHLIEVVVVVPWENHFIVD